MPDFEPEALADTIFANRDNTIYWLEVMAAELQGWAQALKEEDEETLQSWFGDAQEQRRQWLKLRASADWEEMTKSQNVEYAGFLLPAFFGAGAFSRKRDKTMEGVAASPNPWHPTLIKLQKHLIHPGLGARLGADAGPRRLDPDSQRANRGARTPATHLGIPQRRALPLFTAASSHCRGQDASTDHAGFAGSH